jgi:transposase
MKLRNEMGKLLFDEAIELFERATIDHSMTLYWITFVGDRYMFNERAGTGGMPTEATVAHVLVSKYADHRPLYRQAQIYGHQGIDLDRSTLAGWVGKAAYELRPIFDALITDLKRSTKLFMPSRQIAAQSPAG